MKKAHVVFALLFLVALSVSGVQAEEPRPVPVPPVRLENAPPPPTHSPDFALFPEEVKVLGKINTPFTSEQCEPIFIWDSTTSLWWAEDGEKANIAYASGSPHPAFFWNFGDDLLLYQSKEDSTSHMWQRPGKYVVTLIIVNTDESWQVCQGHARVFQKETGADVYLRAVGTEVSRTYLQPTLEVDIRAVAFRPRFQQTGGQDGYWAVSPDPHHRQWGDWARFHGDWFGMWWQGVHEFTKYPLPKNVAVELFAPVDGNASAELWLGSVSVYGWSEEPEARDEFPLGIWLRDPQKLNSKQ